MKNLSDFENAIDALEAKTEPWLDKHGWKVAAAIGLLILGGLLALLLT